MKTHLKKSRGTGEVAQQFREGAALVEDSSSCLRTRMWLTTACISSFREIRLIRPSWAPVLTYTIKDKSLEKKKEK